MNVLKKTLLSATVTTGVVLFIGNQEASADSLYTVKSGDTLSSISHQFNGDNNLINQIAEDNQIADINTIFEGEELMIRTDSPEPEQESVVWADTSAEEEVVNVVIEESTVPNSSDAKEWIAQKESSGSYSAQNGRYIGRYQLDSSYLNGDHSAENQERVADDYVANRYGSWEAAKSFWLANGWY